MGKDEFLGTSEIKIISNIYRQSIERIVFVDGKEKYRDYYVFPCFPSDNDPIRSLGLFLMGEQSKSRRDRSRNSGNFINALKYFWIVGFRKFVQFVSKFFK